MRSISAIVIYFLYKSLEGLDKRAFLSRSRKPRNMTHLVNAIHRFSLIFWRVYWASSRKKIMLNVSILEKNQQYQNSWSSTANVLQLSSVCYSKEQILEEFFREVIMVVQWSI